MSGGTGRERERRVKGRSDARVAVASSMLQAVPSDGQWPASGLMRLLSVDVASRCRVVTLDGSAAIAVAYGRTADQLPFRVMTPVGEPRSSFQTEVPLMELPLIVPV